MTHASIPQNFREFVGSTMLSTRLWRRWCQRLTKKRWRCVRRSGAGSHRRPWIADILEERTLLSTITVTSLWDNYDPDGQLTLREAIVAANTNSSVDGSPAGEEGVQDHIVFRAGLRGTVFLDPDLGQLTITDTVVITGLGT